MDHVATAPKLILAMSQVNTTPSLKERESGGSITKVMMVTPPSESITQAAAITTPAKVNGGILEHTGVSGTTRQVAPKTKKKVCRFVTKLHSDMYRS